MVEVVVIDELLVRRSRVGCLRGAFMDLVICVELFLFKSLDDIGLLMTGDNDGLAVLLPLLIVR